MKNDKIPSPSSPTSHKLPYKLPLKSVYFNKLKGRTWEIFVDESIQEYCTIYVQVDCKNYSILGYNDYTKILIHLSLAIELVPEEAKLLKVEDLQLLQGKIVSGVTKNSCKVIQGFVQNKGISHPCYIFWVPTLSELKEILID